LDYTFRRLTPSDADKIMDLQLAYQKIYSKAVVIPAESYLSPTLGYGENIICAFSDDGLLKGYTAVNANIGQKPEVPHTIWSIVKVDPTLACPRPLQELLFQKAVDKARELVKPYPDHDIRLMFHHHTSEKDAIQFLTSQGCIYAESAFHMMCDLSRELVIVPPPVGITTRYLDVNNAVEVQDYVDGKNECFPLRYITRNDWEFSFKKFFGENGKVITAFENGWLIGGITVSWNEDLNKRIGLDIGETDDVFVREPWRQRNIAAFLIGLGLKYFKESGRRFGHLEVRATNENALKLYKKMGYFAVDESQQFCLVIKETKR
jgi:ribosomal protein S18 acetylase RimI-like enzyme